MQIQSTTNLRNYNNYYTLPYNVSKMSKVHNSFNMSFKGVDELVEAAAKGDLNGVKREVERGTNINGTHEYRPWDDGEGYKCGYNCYSAQAKASENGHAHIIRYLFGLKDFDPNRMDGGSRTGLKMAVKYKHYDIANMYLNHPMIDPNKGYPIYYAYNNDDFDMFCKILNHPKTNPNDEYKFRRGDDGTLLHNAVKNNRTQYIERLLIDPRVELDTNDPVLAPYVKTAKLLNVHKEMKLTQKEQELTEKQKELKNKEQELTAKEAAVLKREEQIDETIKTKTVEIRKEETEKAKKAIAKREKEVEKREDAAARREAEAEEKNVTLDNLIKNYESLISDDVINERSALAIGYRVLYGADSEELPRTMDFDEQTIYVLNVLGKRQDKLTDTSSETPNRITKAIQDDTGNISLDGLKFLERAIDACKEKFSEKDLLDSIKCVKGSYGLFDMKKTALFISNIAWKDNSIRSVIQKVEKYGLK